MPHHPPLPPESSLDPQNWDSIRTLGHRILDEALDYLRTVRDRPVWRHAPDPVKSSFKQVLPLDGQPPEEVYREFRESVLPYPVGNIHPCFWGWVFGTGTVMGAFAEFLAAVMNTNSGDLAHHSALHVEKQVLAWLKEMLEFPASASGLLTSGCSAANLIGLAVARNARAGFDLRKEGLAKTQGKMTLYASQEIHSSIQKAVELLGLGSQSIRYVPVNPRFQIDLESLEAAIARDRMDGLLPFCVVGAAGTVNTGAVDDLQALADLCQRENMWLHVDGAFGAWAKLAPGARDQVAGLERADSLAFDLHKWMYMPYGIGCVLVRDEAEHRKAFSLTPVYLSREQEGRGLTGGDLPWLTDYGFELSRSFNALKAWMSLKEHGVRKYGRIIQQNIDQAHYLGELVSASPELELVAPVTLNVVCFRYLRPGLDEATLDAINKEMIIELQESGIAVLSETTVAGKYVLRVGHTNHRSRREDFRLLVDEVIRLGSKRVINRGLIIY